MIFDGEIEQLANVAREVVVLLTRPQTLPVGDYRWMDDRHGEIVDAHRIT